ncbi:MAG: glycine cleavage system regulatory protein [Bermanella sp.]|jgi:glycine cleavage system regulatory protein
MPGFLIISIMADDRPGLVETLSLIVRDHEGSWLESRMSHLAGKFAGIVQVQVSNDKKETLTNALLALKHEKWVVTVEDSVPVPQGNQPCAKLNIVGNDRPGIIKDMSQVMAKLGVNVLELNTQFESAAMSAEALFKAQADIQTPQSLDLDDLRDALENISNDLMVELTPL